MKRILQALLLISLSFLPWLSYAAPPAMPAPKAPATQPSIDASVRAALALADAQRSRKPRPKPPAPKPAKKDCPCGCGCGPECQCSTGGACPNAECDCAPKQNRSLNLAIDKAVLGNKPLCIWVRQVCPPCEAKLTDCIHAHVTQYERSTGQTVTECCVIVGKPDGAGGLTVAGTVMGLPDDLAEQVRDLLNPRPRMLYVPPPPPPMFFGGFGGNCSS